MNNDLLYDNELIRFMKRNFMEKDKTFDEEYVKYIAEKIESVKLSEYIELYKKVIQNTYKMKKLLKEHMVQYKNTYNCEPKDIAVLLEGEYNIQNIVGFAKSIYISNIKFDLPEIIPIDTGYIGFNIIDEKYEDNMKKTGKSLFGLNNERNI